MARRKKKDEDIPKTAPIADEFFEELVDDIDQAQEQTEQWRNNQEIQVFLLFSPSSVFFRCFSIVTTLAHRLMVSRIPEGSSLTYRDNMVHNSRYLAAIFKVYAERMLH